MPEQTTKTLREEYLKAKQLSKMNIQDGSPETKFQREGAKNRAVSTLPNIERDLLARITRDSVTVVVTEDADALALASQLATENDNVVCLGYKDIDRLIAQTLYPKDLAAGYPINAEFVSRLNSLLAGDVSYQIGADYMPAVKPAATLYGVAKTREELTKKITIMLRGAYGTELNRIYLTKRLNEEIFKRIDNDKIIAILVEVPLELVKEIGKATGRSVVLTTSNYPGAIQYDPAMTATQLRSAIAKAVTAANKGTKTKN